MLQATCAAAAPAFDSHRSHQFQKGRGSHRSHWGREGPKGAAPDPPSQGSSEVGGEERRLAAQILTRLSFLPARLAEEGQRQRESGGRMGSCRAPIPRCHVGDHARKGKECKTALRKGRGSRWGLGEEGHSDNLKSFPSVLSIPGPGRSPTSGLSLFITPEKSLGISDSHQRTDILSPD